MLVFLKRWLGVMPQRTADDVRLAIRYERLGDVPKGDALQGKTVAICLGDQLALTSHESLPDQLRSGEVCWVMSADEIPLQVQTVLNRTVFQVDARIRFDPDNALASFLSGRNEVTCAELTVMIAAHIVELIELERWDVAPLIANDADALSRFRTHLSLLLQDDGIRCVGIDQVKEIAMEQDTTSPMLLEHINVHSLPHAVINRETAVWNSVNMKLRLLDVPVHEINETETPDEQSTGITFPDAKKKPSTWYMMRRHKIDEKLRAYLQHSLTEMLRLCETAKNRQPDFALKAKFTKSEATLKRLQDHLATTPGMVGENSSFRDKQRHLDELLDAVRRGVSASQLANGLLRELASDNVSVKSLEFRLKDLENTLQLLENEIRDRKTVFVCG